MSHHDEHSHHHYDEYDDEHDHEQHDHDHPHKHSHGDGRHGDRHGIIDPSIAASEKGIWAIKWSFVVLFITALFQVIIVWLSGSVALLADTIHNFGDAATGIPLWVAFAVSRWNPNQRFTYGYGRVEDLAGIAIVLTITFSAVVAGFESIQRFLHPQPIGYLWAVVAASAIGFVGNEAVAVFASSSASRFKAPPSLPTATTRAWTGGPVSPSYSAR